MKIRLDTTTKFMLARCNSAVQSCYFIIPWQNVLSCTVWTWLLIYSWWFQQRCSSLFFIKPWTVCSTSNMHEQACQQPCSSWLAQPCSSWPAQPCSSWPAQPCSSWPTGKNKLCIFMCTILYGYMIIIMQQYATSYKLYI